MSAACRTGGRKHFTLISSRPACYTPAMSSRAQIKLNMHSANDRRGVEFRGFEREKRAKNPKMFPFVVFLTGLKSKWLFFNTLKFRKNRKRLPGVARMLQIQARNSPEKSNFAPGRADCAAVQEFHFSGPGGRTVRLRTGILRQALTHARKSMLRIYNDFPCREK